KQEITRPFYLRATQRLHILRELVLRYGRANPNGPLPEYHVVYSDELDNLIPDGRKKLKGIKPGGMIEGNWKYLKTVVRGGSFYIIDRVNAAPAAPPKPLLTSPEELMSELCGVPPDNVEREKETARLFVQAGANPDNVKYQKIAGSDAQNVYVIKEGRTHDVIVVGGHLDKVNSGRGVIDDWSGVCAVTNIYQAIKHIETKHTIIFIGFAKEEAGLVGSDFYVSKLTPTD